MDKQKSMTIKDPFGGKDIIIKYLPCGSQYGKSTGYSKSHYCRDETFDEYMEEELNELFNYYIDITMRSL